MLKIGHEVVRPGKSMNEAPVTIGIPEELERTPGIPLNPREVDWYAREYPLESMNITERASRDWANKVRDTHVEMREIRKEHEKLNRPFNCLGQWPSHYPKGQCAQSEHDSENPEWESVIAVYIEPPTHEHGRQQHPGKIGKLHEAPQLGECFAAKVLAQSRPVGGSAGFSDGK